MKRLMLMLVLILSACSNSAPPPGALLTHTFCTGEGLDGIDGDVFEDCEGPVYCLHPVTLEPLVDQLGMPTIPGCGNSRTAGCWGALTDAEDGFVHQGEIFVWCER